MFVKSVSRIRKMYQIAVSSAGVKTLKAALKKRREDRRKEEENIPRTADQKRNIVELTTAKQYFGEPNKFTF